MDSADSRPILIATDFSDAATDAIREAAHRAQACGARLVALHVVQNYAAIHPLFPQRSQADVSREIELASGLNDRLREAVTAASSLPDGAFDTAVEFDEPYAGIVRKAEAIDAQLVVVANRGHSGIRRLLLGSVAERVVRAAHVPVLVVRRRQATGRLLAATDLSDPAYVALERAAREANELKLAATALHCVEAGASLLPALSAFGPVPPVPDAETLEELRAVTLDLLRQQLERVGFQAEAVVEVAPRADGAILEAAERLDVELIVVGCHGRTGLTRITLGSVSESIVRHAHCNVLAVHIP